MSKFTILRKPVRKTELNIAPLIDMVFLLLIFFMVATTMQKDYGIAVTKPKAATGVILDDKSVVIVISRDGEYLLDKKKTTIDEIKKYFGGDANKNRETGVIIMADEKARTKELITLLDELRNAGVTNISIATEEI